MTASCEKKGHADMYLHTYKTLDGAPSTAPSIKLMPYKTKENEISNYQVGLQGLRPPVTVLVKNTSNEISDDFGKQLTAVITAAEQSAQRYIQSKKHLNRLDVNGTLHEIAQATEDDFRFVTGTHSPTIIDHTTDFVHHSQWPTKILLDRYAKSETLIAAKDWRKKAQEVLDYRLTNIDEAIAHTSIQQLTALDAACLLGLSLVQFSGCYKVHRFRYPANNFRLHQFVVIEEIRSKNIHIVDPTFQRHFIINNQASFNQAQNYYQTQKMHLMLYQLTQEYGEKYNFNYPELNSAFSKMHFDEAAIDAILKKEAIAPTKLENVKNAIDEGITFDIKRDPVIWTTDNGRTQHRGDRAAITEWINTHGTCPYTRRRLTVRSLVPDNRTKQAIMMHILANQQCVPRSLKKDRALEAQRKTQLTNYVKLPEQLNHYVLTRKKDPRPKYTCAGYHKNQKIKAAQAAFLLFNFVINDIRPKTTSPGKTTATQNVSELVELAIATLNVNEIIFAAPLHQGELGEKWEAIREQVNKDQLPSDDLHSTNRSQFTANLISIAKKKLNLTSKQRAMRTTGKQTIRTDEMKNKNQHQSIPTTI